MKSTLIALSVCPCGFPLLDESIPLGTEYDIHPERTESFTFVCGGCHKEQQITCVLVEPRLPGQRQGYLPMLVFENPETKVIVE